MRRIDKIAIANRGEVAVRIIRACQELGIETVLLHSDVDKNTLAFRLSDETVCIGSAPANESYLNIQANIDGAISLGADAIHPGFGFLSENAAFAEACEKNRLIFIGPSADAIRLFGDKISAKNLVKKAGVPVLPGYNGEDQSLDCLLAQVETIGYPAIVKATAGGGGRGLRIIPNKESAKEAIESAMREGLSAFGSSEVFLEKYLGSAKHIEVQVFVDSSSQGFHLYERECSVQRRHQKIIEEAPAQEVPLKVKQQMYDAAIKIAKEAKYIGAGTVEFLYQDGEFYFLEMNTRLQVEHPVTEMVLGVDLVKAQILTASEQSLLWEKELLSQRGHAIECRIYAEDPYNKGVPSTGKLGYCYFPNGGGRRFEVGFEPGDEITSFYDSMIAKVIVWDENRPRAIQKMKTTLKQTIIFGLKTNIPYLLEILSHNEFVDATMTTQFIEKNYPDSLKKPTSSELESLGELLNQSVSQASESQPGGAALHPSPWVHGWEHL